MDTHDSIGPTQGPQIYRLTVPVVPGPHADSVCRSVWNLVHHMRNGGNLDDSNVLVVSNENKVDVIATAYPGAFERSSLTHDAERALDQLAALVQAQPTVGVLGCQPDEGGTCAAPRSSAPLIMLCAWDRLHSGILCSECGSPVPLFGLRDLSDEQRRSAVAWRREFVRMEWLHLWSLWADEDAVEYLWDINGAFFKWSLEVRCSLEEELRREIYYYVPSSGEECPLCRGEWRESSPWLGSFDGRCSNCRVVGLFNGLDTGLVWPCFSDHPASFPLFTPGTG